jgi:hypothetical protein
MTRRVEGLESQQKLLLGCQDLDVAALVVGNAVRGCFGNQGFRGGREKLEDNFPGTKRLLWFVTQGETSIPQNV